MNVVWIISTIVWAGIAGVIHARLDRAIAEKGQKQEALNALQRRYDDLEYRHSELIAQYKNLQEEKGEEA